MNVSALRCFWLVRAEAASPVVETSAGNNPSFLTERTLDVFIRTGVWPEMFGMGGTQTELTETVVLDQRGPVSLGESTELLTEEGGPSLHSVSVTKRLERAGKLGLRLFGFRLLPPRLCSGGEHHSMIRRVGLVLLLLNVLVVGALGSGLVPSDG